MTRGVGLGLGLGLVCLVGCGGGGWSPVAPSGTEQESHILAETARFATKLHVDVRGELTDKAYMVNVGAAGCPGPTPCMAAGWYDRGVAYYYRPYIVKQTDFRYLSAIAAHEVCHALEFNHGPRHEACIVKAES